MSDQIDIEGFFKKKNELSEIYYEIFSYNGFQFPSLEVFLFLIKYPFIITEENNTDGTSKIYQNFTFFHMKVLLIIILNFKRTHLTNICTNTNKIKFFV